MQIMKPSTPKVVAVASRAVPTKYDSLWEVAVHSLSQLSSSVCEDKNAIRPLSSIRKKIIGSVDVESFLGSAFTCYHICCQDFLYDFLSFSS